MGYSISIRLIEHSKVEVPKVALLWITFIITFLNTKKGGPLRDLPDHLSLPWTEIMKTKVILRIFSKALIYEISEVKGMAVGMPTVTP